MDADTLVTGLIVAAAGGLSILAYRRRLQRTLAPGARLAAACPARHHSLGLGHYSDLSRPETLSERERSGGS